MLWIYFFCLYFWHSDGRIVPWDQIKPRAFPYRFPGIEAIMDNRYESSTSRTTMDLDDMWLDDFETLPVNKQESKRALKKVRDDV